MNFHDFYNRLFSSELFGVSVTVVAYVVATAIHRRFRYLPTLIVICAAIIALLLACHIPYDQYKRGGDVIYFFLGPATVALGVPFYRQASKLRGHVPSLLTAIALGSIAGMAGSGLLVWLFHGSRSVLLSMLPKTATTPIAIAICKQLVGGEPDLTAVFAVMSGLIGGAIGPRLLRFCGVRNDLAIGVAMGTSAGGIGTARLIRDSELQAGMSGFAMALTGIFTSIIAIPVVWWVNHR
jgi:predicted murein hydrolase (TIGR00659 family)